MQEDVHEGAWKSCLAKALSDLECNIQFPRDSPPAWKWTHRLKTFPGRAGGPMRADRSAALTELALAGWRHAVDAQLARCHRPS